MFILVYEHDAGAHIDSHGCPFFESFLDGGQSLLLPLNESQSLRLSSTARYTRLHCRRQV